MRLEHSRRAEVGQDPACLVGERLSVGIIPPERSGDAERDEPPRVARRCAARSNRSADRWC